MSNGRSSLLAGRHVAQLNGEEIRRAINTFLGFDSYVAVKYDANSRTLFRVSTDESGHEYGEIIFGPDIYPGSSVVDPNSALSLEAAAAHELTHYHRWKDKTALSGNALHHIDEALTSLEAISRYRRLSETDCVKLVADAIQRLQLFAQEQIASAAAQTLEAK